MFRLWWSRLARFQTNLCRPRGRAVVPRHRPRACRPSLEVLEDRLTPATFLVVNSADNLLPGSLRYALSQANLNPGSTVAIAPSVTGPINLTRGELLITADVTVRNDSGAAVAIHQLRAHARVFHVSGSSALDVTFAGGPSSPLVITGGSVRGGNGGGILIDTANSQLTLTDVVVAGNRALPAGTPGHTQGGSGGGIYSQGSVALTASAVLGNEAGVGGGGIVVNQGAVTLSAGSSVSHNTAPHGVGGGISVADGSVFVSGGSHVDGNAARDVGGIMVGAVPSFGDVAVSVTGGSTVNQNASTGGRHQSPRDLGGGGIAVVSDGNVLIDASQVSGNQTVGMYSGGIVVGLGNVTVTDGSQIDGNSNNGPGGGIAANFDGQVTVSGASQVNSNTGAALGGGIVNFSGPQGLVQVSGGSQVSGNTLTNGETIGRAVATFLEVVYGKTAFEDFAAAVGGAGGAAMRGGLRQLDAARRGAAGPLRATAGSLSHPLGVLVAGGGIGVLLAPVAVTDGGQVNGNLCGQNVLNHRLIGLGGGIFQVRGPVSIDRGHVDGNRAPFGDGGGIWSGGVLTVLSGTVSGNTAAGQGGGLMNVSGGQATVQGSALLGNQAVFGGGATNLGQLAITQSIIGGNTATIDGGGIFWAGGDLTTTGVVFVNNSPNNIAIPKRG